MDFRAVFHNPVVSGQPAIQVTMLHVAADLLGANQAHHQMLIIHVGRIRTAADVDMITALAILEMAPSCKLPLGKPNFKISL